MFYDPREFAFTAPLEQNWKRIYAEFLSIRHEMVEWVERDLYDNKWLVFGLYGFPHGDPMTANIAKCPVTASLIHDHQPHHGAAGFSVLTPGTNLKPHHGYQGEFLRCHLGLAIPDGDCRLRVEDETRKWEPGQVIVFDDRAEHEAWNRTAEDRAVLLFDFVPDPSVYTRAAQARSSD